jgi:proline iminopeptidase
MILSWLPGVLGIVLVIAPPIFLIEQTNPPFQPAAAPAGRPHSADRWKVAPMKSEISLPSGEGRFVSRDGLSLWYKISGHGPALLVPTPGWGASSDMYMKSLISLEKDFSLIFLDTRGAGRSEAPPTSAGYAFHLFLDDLETLRMHLHLDRWLIFAHSGASWQAMAYAIEYPKPCRGLFIVDGTPNLDDKRYRDNLAALMKKLSHQPWFAAANKASELDPKSDAEFTQSFHVSLPLYFASYAAAQKAKHFFSASTYHFKPLKYNENAPKFSAKKLAQIHVPTALFEGDEDVITTPLEARRLHRGIANSTLFMIKDSGHFPWLEQPDIFFRDFAEAARTILKTAHTRG